MISKSVWGAHTATPLLFMMLVIFGMIWIPVSHAVTNSESIVLRRIAYAYGFEWATSSSGFCGVGATDPNLRAMVGCSGNNEITSLSFEGVNLGSGCRLNNTGFQNIENYSNNGKNGFAVFTKLKTLTIRNAQINANASSLFTLLESTTMTNFEYQGGSCSFNFEAAHTVMLSTIKIDGLASNFPRFSTKTTRIYINQKPGSSMQPIASSLFEGGFFGPQLIDYEVFLSSQNYLQFSTYNLSTALTSAPYLEKFSFQYPGFPMVVKPFYQPPITLTTLGLYKLTIDNNTFPSPSDVSWGKIYNLSLAGLSYTGSVDNSFIDSTTLNSLNLNGNPSLSIIIGPTFGIVSTIKSLSISQTGITTPLPSNILSDNVGDGLLYFDARNNTGLKNTTLPVVFLCLPQSYLVDDFDLPTYLIDDTYTNYWGPSTPRDCSVTINSISPVNPIPGNTTSITINGRNLVGSVYSYKMINTVGQSWEIHCHSKTNTQLMCYSPFFLQGKGNVSVTVTIGNSVSTAVKAFAYSIPSITSVSSISTLGGTITLLGYDMMSAIENPPLQTGITIGSNPCTNIQIINQLTYVTCDYPAGVISGVPVLMQVKGQYNNQNLSPKFYYNSPIVSSSIALQPNIVSNLTIQGSEFWNDPSIVTVTIGGSIDCPVLEVNHNILICQFPATPYSSGTKNILVNVNGQTSQPNSMFAFIDTNVCPNGCGVNGVCDVGVGSCNCKLTSGAVAGPSCANSTLTSALQAPQTNTSPKLKMTLTSDSGTKFDAYLVSIIENGAETFINSWSGAFNQTERTWTYVPTTAAKDLTIVARHNPVAIQDTVGGSSINLADNSFSYIVKYQTVWPVLSLQFKLAFDIYPSECIIPPSLTAYPTGATNSSLRWLEMTKGGVTWYARFPLAVSLNDGDGNGRLSTTLDSTASLTTTVLVNVNTESMITNSEFQFDFQALSAGVSRQVNPPCPEDNSSTSPQTVTEAPDNKWKVTVGVVVGVVGGAIVGVGSFFIIRQRRQLNRTKSILDKKLSQLHLSGEL